ncbi:RNase H domain-containing protein [Trichonephila clavipes]|uniref:RNase H domain-containing protein n=1 Tax=Trichonephila clavipes TaxID=2585209 RepID=A0A8X6V5P8_TRICX|nr:RNase H domain-containing protein [Trichonephila clavipes]
MWTAPELASPLLTTTPYHRVDASALDRFNVHRCPTRTVLGNQRKRRPYHRRPCHSNSKSGNRLYGRLIRLKRCRCVFFISPNREYEYYKIQVRKIASNYTCELIAIKSALENLLSKSSQDSSGIISFKDSKSTLQAIQKGKCQISHKIIQSFDKIIIKKRSCTQKWIPTHVNILGNEKADELAKEPRACPQSSNLTTLMDANPVASRRLINNNFKYSIPVLNSNRTIASIIIRLRTKHVKEMKISTVGQRNYTNHCPNCPNVHLSP